MEEKGKTETIAQLSYEDKFELIEKIKNLDSLSGKEIRILDALSYDKDQTIRSEVAETLENFNSTEAKKILLRLLNDKSGLVRAVTCDSFRFSGSVKILNLLVKKMINDKCPLVRGYAASSIADLIININETRESYIEFFERFLNTEKDKWVKINIYRSLYILGATSYLQTLIQELNSRSYKNRVAVVNILYEIYSEDNQEQIVKTLTERLEIEKTVAVKSVIDEVLSIIKADYQ